jgi:hypothetical protein
LAKAAGITSPLSTAIFTVPLPANRRTEINPILLNTLLRRRPDLLAYDVPHRSH